MTLCNHYWLTVAAAASFNKIAFACFCYFVVVQMIQTINVKDKQTVGHIKRAFT